MGQWKKSSSELISLHAELASLYRCVNKPMFGFQVFFVNDNMFTGIYEDGITLRLTENDRAEIMAQSDEITPFTPLGRTMKEYVLVPEHLLSDKDFAQYWMDKSYAYVSSLPPKTKKEKKLKVQGG
ncbi:MAG: TfoX/Sxy family protein [Clostridiales bacterium]|nr:TfoX/Sxy family protein [Clostridiales bacterium]